MSDFIELADDGHRFICPMPKDETVVEVRLRDGTTRLAWYACDIMDLGDWDFVPVNAVDEEPDNQESIAGEVAAWRPASQPQPDGS